MKTILIVDDEPDIVELVTNRLEAHHFRVIAASDGQEGLTKAREENPDLILMDIMMPQLSGGDAVRKLKANECTRHIPVIFLTGVYGKRMEGMEAKGINVGGEFYQAISKPFHAESLIAIINQSLKMDQGA